MLFFTSLKLSIAKTQNTIYQTWKLCHRQKGVRRMYKYNDSKYNSSDGLVNVVLLC